MKTNSRPSILRKDYLSENNAKVCLAILLSVLILSIILLSSVPPVSRDALTHHLAIPKLYLKNGGIYKIPTNVFSFYPMNLDLLYMVPLYLGNDIAPKFIHFSFALMTAGLIFGYLRKRTNTLYALLGALLFLSTPVIVKLSISVYVDLGLIFFSTASIVYFLKWIENKFKLSLLVISAVWCGLALGTKYNGLLVYLLLTLFVPFVYVRGQNGGLSHSVKAMGFGVLFMLVAALVFSPWLTRNYIWTQNPIYPLYQNWFVPQKVASKADTAPRTEANVATQTKIKSKATHSKLMPISYRKVVYNESWWEICLVPLRIFFQGKDDEPRYFDGKLNPLLFFLPFFAFGGRRKDSTILRTEKWVLLSFTVLYVAITFFRIHMRIRYIAPIIPPLVILSMLGLERMGSIFTERYTATTGKRLKRSVLFMVLVFLGLNAVYVVAQFRHVNPLSYLSGRVDRDAYIETYRREYPVFQFANENLPENSKILCVMLGNRIYYSDRETLSTMHLFYRGTKNNGSAEKILRGMKKRRVTHLMVRYDLFNRWTEDNFNEKEKKIIGRFFQKYSKLLYFKNGYGLFRLH